MLISVREVVAWLGGVVPRGVIHVGAHEGEEARDYLAAGVNRVLWVEANEGCKTNLEDNLRRYPGLDSKVVWSALSDKDGEEAVLRVTNNGQSTSILPLGTHKGHYPDIHVVSDRPVRTQRFDTVVRSLGVEVPGNYHLVNLDIQGAELKALHGFGDLVNLPDIRGIYTEVNTEEVYQGCCLVSDLDTFLFAKGFSRVRTEMTDRGWGDALYVRNSGGWEGP